MALMLQLSQRFRRPFMARGRGIKTEGKTFKEIFDIRED